MPPTLLSNPALTHFWYKSVGTCWGGGVTVLNSSRTISQQKRMWHSDWNLSVFLYPLPPCRTNCKNIHNLWHTGYWWLMAFLFKWHVLLVNNTDICTFYLNKLILVVLISKIYFLKNCVWLSGTTDYLWYGPLGLPARFGSCLRFISIIMITKDLTGIKLIIHVNRTRKQRLME